MYSIVALPSAARTTAVTSAPIETKQTRAAHVILDVTADPALASITLSIEGYDAASNTWYTLLSGAAVNAVSTTIYKVSPDLPGAANSVAQDHLPPSIRISIAVAGADSMTYSVGVNLCG